MGSELNLTGRLGLLRDFRRCLQNRLRIREALRRHPEIRDQQIIEPIFIIGSPRTGTTMLHNLMARMSMARIPGLAAPRLWELLEPAPHGELGPGQTDPRIVSARRLEAEVKRMLPQLQAAHPLVWNWPDECLWLFANSMQSEMYLARLPVPGYRRMLEQADWSWAIEEYAEQLQVLQWQRGGEVRWVLKCPGHAFRMRELQARFPDARFVRTHRDPRVTIASMCSLFELGHLPATRTVDLRELGRGVLRTWVDCGFGRLLEASETIDGSRCFDIDFRELMRDPFGVIERMLAHFGRELGDAHEMRAWLENNPRHKRGRHSYALERYGISEAEALDHTEGYRARFRDFLADGPD